MNVIFEYVDIKFKNVDKKFDILDDKFLKFGFSFFEEIKVIDIILFLQIVIVNSIKVQVKINEKENVLFILVIDLKDVFLFFLVVSKVIEESVFFFKFVEVFLLFLFKLFIGIIKLISFLSIIRL